MRISRREAMAASMAPAMAALGSATAGFAQTQTGAKKRVLASLGDAYHAPAYLDAALVARLRRSGWRAVTIIDYNVPWDDFASYDQLDEWLDRITSELARWDKANPHTFEGTYGDYLLGKVGKVFPQLVATLD